MNAVMLDTNIVPALVKDPRGAIAERIRALSGPACISVVVAAELRYGAARKGSARLTKAIESVLDVLAVEPLAPPVDRTYAVLRASLERSGGPMGANDLMIAAQAIALERVLVTHDRGFLRVPHLRVEDWLA